VCVCGGDSKSVSLSSVGKSCDGQQRPQTHDELYNVLPTTSDSIFATPFQPPQRSFAHNCPLSPWITLPNPLKKMHSLSELPPAAVGNKSIWFCCGMMLYLSLDCVSLSLSEGATSLPWYCQAFKYSFVRWCFVVSRLKCLTFLLVSLTYIATPDDLGVKTLRNKYPF